MVSICHEIILKSDIMAHAVRITMFDSTLGFDGQLVCFRENAPYCLMLDSYWHSSLLDISAEDIKLCLPR